METKTDLPAMASKPVSTSPKLVEIQNEINAVLDSFSTAASNAEKLALNAKLTKLQADEKAEVFAIAQAAKTAEAAAKIAAANAKIDNFAQLAVSNYLVQNDKKAAQEEKDASAEAYNAMCTELKNKFLPVHASMPKSAKTAEGSTPSTKGAKTAEIREIIAPMYAQGIDGKTIRKHIISELGYNDGTANSVILAYEKELGQK